MDRLRTTAGLVGVAVLLASALGLLMEPISRDASHLGRGILAAFGIALLAFRAGVPERLRGTFLAALAALGTIGWFNYYQFDRAVFTGINDYVDTAYYYTNSKYLAELGYDGLYAGALLCDAERGSPRTDQVREIRDLRDDVMRPVSAGLEHGREVKAAFRPERWDAFCHDITWFLDRLDRKTLKSNFFVDHGYNPPPTWTLVGGNLSHLVEVERLKWICLADTVVVAAMLAAVAWAFGLETMLWGMLFWVVTFSGRWPILGMAILRFDWVAGVVVGMALLHKQRAGAAGAAMAYAALNRIFPAIFFWGWLVAAARDVWRERRVPRKHVAFAAGAALATTLMMGAAAVQYGVPTLAASAHHLRLHNESFSSHRVGLATVLVYRGETTREQINANGGMRTKELAVQAMMPVLRGLAVAFLVLIAAYAWRNPRVAAWELVPLAALPLFCATTPQVNYYNLRLALVTWHGAQLDRPLHRVLLAILLLAEVASQLGQVAGVDRHAVNAWTSIVLLAYYVVLAGWLASRVVRPAPEP